MSLTTHKNLILNKNLSMFGNFGKLWDNILLNLKLQIISLIVGVLWQMDVTRWILQPPVDFLKTKFWLKVKLILEIFEMFLHSLELTSAPKIIKKINNNNEFHFHYRLQMKYRWFIQKCIFFSLRVVGRSILIDDTDIILYLFKN